MEALDIRTVVYALAGGILPACLWLYFWLKEDNRCPEPPALIILAFFCGMLAVPLVIPFQLISRELLPDGTPVLFAWALVEEVMKYAMLALFVLWRRAVNEPVDFMMYMVTGAIGFAALENALFLVGPLQTTALGEFIVTGNLRFLGATLLHVVCSAAIGFALALSFYRHRASRFLYVIGGLVLAVALHLAFNILILSGSGVKVLGAFFFVWTNVAILFVLFEVAKWLRLRRLPPALRNTCDV